ncbi:DUF1822 family protein [Planktothrix pseudagardhii]|uniref:DUF1822 family protein n=1 Tax=Planktothrix pseudagardhii TaxID=132604 RepID=A0A9W4CGF9_9CYAN|nr:DUF1822 family protein [Planktothrix pseudagardhii]CAD5927505.1 hypothetical protein NO713_01070 [Planktothrix pseudagardhii]
MTFTLEQLNQAYPDQLVLEFTPEEQAQALPSAEDYSYDAAYYRAYINRLCLNSLLPVLQDEAEQNQSPQVFPSAEFLPSIWEFINGMAINIGKSRLVIIPSEAMDTEEICVPQEWVDIPEWAGDYYLAVQVNLEDQWLRVWGFTTHRKLKSEGRYDPSDRTYSLDSEDLFENLNTLWVSLKLCQEEKAVIEPLPKLSTNQIERFLSELSKPSSYSPRLKIPFVQWGAFLASDNLREQLYYRRIGKESTMHKLVNLSEHIFHQLWLSLDELVQVLNLNLAVARSRSGDAENRTPEISRGRIIDLGIQLAGHPVALILRFTNESDNKRNILLQLHPGRGYPYLPPDVELIVLDDTGGVFLEARSRKADNWIQLEFRGEPGEKFSVKVALGDASIIENFII